MLEPVAEFIVNSADDFGAGFGKIGVSAGRFVDEIESCFVVDADAVEEPAFETELFNEPAGVDFVAVATAVDGVTFVLGTFGGAVV